MGCMVLQGVCAGLVWDGMDVFILGIASERGLRKAHNVEIIEMREDDKKLARWVERAFRYAF